MLVGAIDSPRRNLPKIAQHLAESQVKKGSVVVTKTKTWTNPGTSRHARPRQTVLEVSKDGIVKCQCESKAFAYDLMDGKGSRLPHTHTLTALIQENHSHTHA